VICTYELYDARRAMSALEEQEIPSAAPSEALVEESSGWLGWLEKSVTLTLEHVLIASVFLAAVMTRLWGLGWRVMSHDESLHVFYSWMLATGKGYVHDPMMHGPLLFEATALINVIFGANDFTSRLAPALLGIFLVVGIPQLFKPWLGKWGALAASLFFLISPFVLYYARYIRHDPIEIVWMLLLVRFILGYLDNAQERNLIGISIALALMFATMEVTFIYLAILAVYLAVRLLLATGFHWSAIRASREFDVLVVIASLGAFFSSPILLILLNPIWTRLTGAPFVDVNALSVQGTEWATGVVRVRMVGLLAVFWMAAAYVGLWWDWRRWWKLAAIFAAITLPLFTTFFTNLAGLGTGFVGSLGYWLSQQTVARGGQPWYYFLIVLPLYEYLPLLAGIAGAVVYFVRRKALSERERTFLPLVICWAVGITLALSLAGEKMPWHSVQVIVPFILLSAWLVTQVAAWGGAPILSQRAHLLQAGTLGIVGVLALLTARTSYFANYINYDYPTEFQDYAHGAPGVKWAMDAIGSVAQVTGDGSAIKIAYDNDTAWPMSWYLREYPSSIYYDANPSRENLDVPVVLVGPNNWTKVDALIGQTYTRYEFDRMWWPMEDYKDLTWDRIRGALTDPAMRAAVWNIFWARDYRAYAALTHQQLDPPANWPLQERMRIYIRKDLAAQLPKLAITPYQLPDLPKPVDNYAPVRQQLTPLGVITPSQGLSGPRNVAVGTKGQVYVVDTGNSRILELDANGNLVKTWGEKSPDPANPATGTFNEPWGIAVDGQGNVYVADTWNHRIQKFSADGSFLLTFGVSGQAAEGPDRFWGPRGVAVDSQGRVYVTDTGNKRIEVFDANGKPLLGFATDGTAKLDEPVGIAVGPDGRVFVADTWNMRVAIFGADGQFQSAFPVQAWPSNSLDNKPYLTVDSQGRVYLTDPEGYRVIVFDPNGKALAEFGQYGPENNSFGLPTGLALAPDGSLWVADAGNNRVEHYPALFGK
jgi:uncharacterized protein (TIGR03663 family)